MQSIFGLIYILLFFSYILVGMFIIFHILRYSLNRSSGILGAGLFSFVFVILLFTNFILFTTLPLNSLLAHSF
ncbi:MAG: hypothetical protein WCG73_00375 [Candidatus Moraniibacteriota bacterium]